LINKLKWKWYFENYNSNTSIQIYNPKLKLKSTECTHELPVHIESKLTILKNTLIQKIQNTPLRNTNRISNNLIQTIKNMKYSLPHIKFVQSDKNLGLLAIDTKTYDTLVMTHLTNESIYKCICNIYANNNPMSNIISDTYFKLLNHCTDFLNPPLTRQEKTFIATLNTILPPFHILPKIHKSPLKGRPIVGAKAWVTTNFSILLDIRLQPYTSKYNTILKNNIDLINLWKGKPFDVNTQYLVSLDVESLYTNLNINKAVNLISQHNNSLGTLAHLIMLNNYFEYNENIYHQLDGIAMGTNAAVSIANLYLAILIDQKLIKNSNISYYCRYIDDIGFIFTGTETELLTLINSAQNYENDIKFTYVYSKTSLDILDLTFYIKNGRLEFKTYQKSINKYLYLSPFSHHHPSIIKGFIKGELNRYKITNSERENELLMKNLFFNRLLNRGYTTKYLTSLFNPTKTHIFIKKSSENTIVFPISYQDSPRVRLLKDIILNLNEPDQIPIYFNSDSLIKHIWCTHPNISNLLLQSRLSKPQSDFLEQYSETTKTKTFKSNNQSDNQKRKDLLTKQNRIISNRLKSLQILRAKQQKLKKA
jgi:hypothetical protein